MSFTLFEYRMISRPLAKHMTPFWRTIPIAMVTGESTLTTRSAKETKRNAKR